MVNENTLIKELKIGNIKALEYLVRNYSNIAFKVSYSVLNNKELSEECVNDVLLKVWNNIKSFKGDKEKFKKWLMVMAKYTAIDMLRKEIKFGDNVSLEEFIAIQGDSIEDQVEASEIEELIEKEINKMDEINKEIFKRRFFRGESVKKIALDMGVSESSISNRLLRGKNKLKLVIGGEN